MTQNESWAARAKAVLTPNYRQQPLAFVRGEGVRVWDADGREYFDFLCGVAVNVLGHCNPAVTRALEEQARTLWHVSNHFYIPRQVELAEALLRVTPFAKRAFFCNSGAEANEAMLKLARKFHHDRGQPQRHEIIATNASFHGRSLFTVTCTGQPKYQEGFAPLVPGVRHVPYGDAAALEAALSDRTAAFIVEPIQGESGVLPAPEGYLAKARELTRKAGALLLVDEVQTGMARTGRWWGHEWEGITPDVISSAKALGNGIPIGAILASEEVGSHLTGGSHGSTFGGNPLATAVALAVVKEIEAVLPEARRVSERLFAGLRALESTGRVAQVRGRGMLIGVCLKGVDAADVMRAARERGLIVNAIGAGVIRLAPPLNLTAAEADEALSRLADALQAAPAKAA